MRARGRLRQLQSQRQTRQQRRQRMRTRQTCTVGGGARHSRRCECACAERRRSEGKKLNKARCSESESAATQTLSRSTLDLSLCSFARDRQPSAMRRFRYSRFDSSCICASTSLECATTVPSHCAHSPLLRCPRLRSALLSSADVCQRCAARRSRSSAECERRRSVSATRRHTRSEAAQQACS